MLQLLLGALIVGSVLTDAEEIRVCDETDDAAITGPLLATPGVDLVECATMFSVRELGTTLTAATFCPCLGVLSATDAETLLDCKQDANATASYYELWLECDAGQTVGGALQPNPFHSIDVEHPDLGPFGIVVGDGSGVLAHYESPGYDLDVADRVASASKWVAGAALMFGVEQGLLTLETKASELLPWWDLAVTGGRDPTFQHLLSFTAGVAEDVGPDVRAACRPSSPPDGSDSLEACAAAVMAHGFVAERASGEYLFYDGQGYGLTVAAAMVLRAGTTLSGGPRWATFDELFDEALRTPLGLSPEARFHSWSANGASYDGSYDEAGDALPVLGGGLVISGSDYARFLLAMFRKTRLGVEVTDSIEADHTSALGAFDEDTPYYEAGLGAWHRGLGTWLECELVPWSTEACFDEHHIVSSVGVYGFTPWIDRTHEYWAMIAVRMTGGNSELVGAAARGAYLKVRSGAEAAIQNCSSTDPAPECPEQGEIWSDFDDSRYTTGGDSDGTGSSIARKLITASLAVAAIHVWGA